MIHKISKFETYLCYLYSCSRQIFISKCISNNCVLEKLPISFTVSPLEDKILTIQIHNSILMEITTHKFYTTSQLIRKYWTLTLRTNFHLFLDLVIFSYWQTTTFSVSNTSAASSSEMSSALQGGSISIPTSSSASSSSVSRSLSDSRVSPSPDKSSSSSLDSACPSICGIFADSSWSSYAN